MAKDFIFILGRDPELSILELESYFEARKINFSIKHRFNEALIISLPPLNFKKVISDLGGTSKIGSILDPAKDTELYTGTSNKLRYTISMYGEFDEELYEEIRETLKERFKAEKLKAMFEKSGSKKPYLDPSEVISKKILSGGFELIVIGDHIAKTVAVYNPKEYKLRDLGKPANRPLHTISVRLAKILINLSGAKPGDTLIDPFCGIGVILQEALMMGMNVVGMDISKECIRDSLKNLEWTKKRYSTKGKYQLHIGDSGSDLKRVGHVDTMATEPYMGPFLKKIPTKEKAQKIMRELRPLYSNFLLQAKKIMKGRAVIIAPRFRLYTGERVELGFKRLAERAGFTVVKSSPIIYTSTRSKIEREIWLLE